MHCERCCGLPHCFPLFRSGKWMHLCSSLIAMHRLCMRFRFCMQNGRRRTCEGKRKSRKQIGSIFKNSLTYNFLPTKVQ